MTIPGGNPVTAAPGLTPRSPLTTVAPTFVTVAAASTANVAADPKGTAIPCDAFCAQVKAPPPPPPGGGPMRNDGTVQFVLQPVNVVRATNATIRRVRDMSEV